MVMRTLDKRRVGALLQNVDAFATSLLAVAVNDLGVDIMGWEPESLSVALSERYGVELPRINKDKLQALILTYTTDLPFVSVEAFNNVCNVLSGSEANFMKWDILSPEEALWGMYEMLLHTGVGLEQGEAPPEFSHEVRQYLGIILRNAGIEDPPDMLRIAEMTPLPASRDQWADDPIMFNAAFDAEQLDKLRLLQFLGLRISALVMELDGLPIKHGESWDKIKTAILQKASRLSRAIDSVEQART